MTDGGLFNDLPGSKFDDTQVIPAPAEQVMSDPPQASLPSKPLSMNSGRLSQLGTYAIWMSYFATCTWWLVNCTLVVKSGADQPSGLDYLPAGLQFIIWNLLVNCRFLRVKSVAWLISLLFEAYIAINIYAIISS